MNKGFWRSEPGILTGIVALITASVAVVGFFIATSNNSHNTSTQATTTETITTETSTTETSTTEMTTTETTTTETPSTAPAGDTVAGMQVFESAGCTACHTLADAGATGTVGPDLDQAKPSAALVVDRVTNGMGAMPPFEGQLSEEQIQDVAAYVSSAAGQ